MRFDNCLALQKSFLEQETCLENIISYTDGLRNDIYVGDKVLAPVGEDGRYGSGVLVEGVDLRKGQSEGKVLVLRKLLQSVLIMVCMFAFYLPCSFPIDGPVANFCSFLSETFSLHRLIINSAMCSFSISNFFTSLRISQPPVTTFSSTHLFPILIKNEI